MTTTKNQSSRPLSGDLRYLLFAAMLGAATLLPCLLWGFPVGADFDNHVRFALPLYDELAIGNFFPGWLAESNDGFGDPRFRFYPPLLYYVLCGFRLLSGDWYFAALAAFTFFSVTGAVGVFFWARKNMSQGYAVVAAGLFAFMPYHLAQFYQASLLAEYAAACMLPFAFAAVERLLTNGDNSTSRRFRDVAALSAAYSLIVTTHLPTAVIGSLALGAFALLTTDWRDGRKQLLFCAWGIAIGLIASAWFLGRMLPELNWIQAGQNISSAYYDYRNNFSFSPFAPSNRNTFYASILTALTTAMLLPAMTYFRRFLFPTDGASQPDEITRPKQLGTALLLSLIAVVMTTDISRPVWAVIPKLKDVQFPYRWLAIASVAGAPVIAATLSIWLARIVKRDLRPLHFAILGIFVFAFCYSIYDLAVDADYLTRAKFSERIVGVRGGRSFNDWLPVGAAELKDLKPMNAKVEAGDRNASVIEWDSHRRVFRIDAATGEVARVRTYYYPLWRAYEIRANGRQPLNASAADDGTMLVSLPAGNAMIEVVFDEPPRTRWSIIFSLCAWATIAVTFLAGVLRRQARPAE